MNLKDKTFITALWKMLVPLVLLLPATLTAAGQNHKLQNRPYVDLRKFHYGFMIGLHQESLHLKNNGLVNPDDGRQWFASNDRYDPSFTVGVLGEWRLHPNFSLRLEPTMHFGTKHVTFRDQTSDERLHQEIKSTYISLPVDIKFSAPRHNNYRPYLKTGFNVMYDLTTKDNNYLKMKPLNTFFEIAFGCDYYLPFFKLIPELKFLIGLNDVLEKDRKDLQDKTLEIFTKSIDNAHVNMIVLTLYFE